MIDFTRHRLPLIVAPMFLVSTPELVIAGAEAGVIAGLPAPNARTTEILNDWMEQIHAALSPDKRPWLFNMFVHSTYDRFERELALVERYQPTVVSTALGSPKHVIEVVKGYGGSVFADVITPEMARKSVAAGVDALILVTQGAGGHTGRYHPLAFLQEVRSFWQGPIGIAGCISTGSDIAAMVMAGADFVVAGTRFIAANESMASDGYVSMMAESTMTDIVESKAVSGVLANWMMPSLIAAGIDPAAGRIDKPIDLSGNRADKAWKNVWSAGQGVGRVGGAQPCSVIVDSLCAEFETALVDRIPRLAIYRT